MHKTLMVAGLLVAVPAQAQAQGYPGRPIRMIVASAPGGAPHIPGRAVAQEMFETLGQPVVVGNRAGAGRPKHNSARRVWSWRTAAVPPSIGPAPQD